MWTIVELLPLKHIVKNVRTGPLTKVSQMQEHLIGQHVDNSKEIRSHFDVAEDAR